jgi:hypothetical protein
MGKDPNWNVPASCVRQARGIGTIAEHEHDLGGRTRTQRAKQRLQVAAAARNGHGYPHRHGGGR